jgi:hypothetical protein
MDIGQHRQPHAETTLSQPRCYRCSMVEIQPAGCGGGGLREREPAADLMGQDFGYKALGPARGGAESRVQRQRHDVTVRVTDASGVTVGG